MYQPALAPASPKGGKWSFRTLKGLVSRRGRWVHVHVLVNILYTKFKLIVPIHSCKLEPVHGRAPACPRTCSSWGRKAEHPHSQGLSELRELAGVHTCTGQLSLKQMSNIDANAGIIITIIPYIISYHIIAPTLDPNPTPPCCMSPTYRKPSPKRGKSAPKTTLTNIYIKPLT